MQTRNVLIEVVLGRKKTGFLSGDVHIESVPSHRLAVAGRTGDIGFVLYDSATGGGGRRFLLLVQFVDEQVIAFCRFILSHEVASIEDAKAAVPESLHEMPGYGGRRAPN